jgi:NADH-quinone oxidoreductase subunit B
MNTQTVAYDSKVEGEVIVTRADAVINWIRKNSVWPMPMGLACCAIELMAAGGSRFDISRFGMEVMRFSPRQADCMIVAGTVTYKMAEVVRRIYEQMGDPKWVVAMGACASSGGMYRSYATLQGVCEEFKNRASDEKDSSGRSILSESYNLEVKI